MKEHDHLMYSPSLLDYFRVLRHCAKVYPDLTNICMKVFNSPRITVLVSLIVNEFQHRLLNHEKSFMSSCSLGAHHLPRIPFLRLKLHEKAEDKPMDSFCADLIAEVHYECHVSHCEEFIAGINALGIESYILRWVYEKQINGIC